MHLTPLSSIIANTWRTPFTVTFLFSILVVEESCRSTSLEADAADKADKEAGLWWNMMDTSLGTCHCCCRWCRCWYVCMSFSLPWFGRGECGCCSGVWLWWSRASSVRVWCVWTVADVPVAPYIAYLTLGCSRLAQSVMFHMNIVLLFWRHPGTWLYVRVYIHVIFVNIDIHDCIMFAWKSCESKIIFDSFKLLESSEEYVCRFSKPQLLEVRSSNNNLSGIEWCERRWLFPSKLEDPRSGWRCLVELSWTKLGKIRLIGGVGVVHELIWHKWYKIYQNMMKKQDARLFLHFIIGFRCSECFPQLSWEDVQGHQVETVNKDENRWRCNRTFDAKKLVKTLT